MVVNAYAGSVITQRFGNDGVLGRMRKKKRKKSLDTRIRTKDQQITTVATTVCRSTGLSYVECLKMKRLGPDVFINYSALFDTFRRAVGESEGIMSEL